MSHTASVFDSEADNLNKDPHFRQTSLSHEKHGVSNNMMNTVMAKKILANYLQINHNKWRKGYCTFLSLCHQRAQMPQ